MAVVKFQERQEPILRRLWPPRDHRLHEAPHQRLRRRLQRRRLHEVLARLSEGQGVQGGQVGQLLRPAARTAGTGGNYKNGISEGKKKSQQRGEIN